VGARDLETRTAIKKLAQYLARRNRSKFADWVPSIVEANGIGSRAGGNVAAPATCIEGSGSLEVPEHNPHGDAAHLIPPFGAHGGNTDLRDAALLADCFSSHPTRAELQERLQRYQQEMLGYGFRQVKSAKGMMRLALGRNALLRFALLDGVPALLRGKKSGTA
jgi:hypothetical protein